MPKPKLKHGEHAALAKFLDEPADKIRRWYRNGKFDDCIRGGKYQKKKIKGVIYERIAPKQQAAQNVRWGNTPKPEPPAEAPETETEIRDYLTKTIGELSELNIYDLQKYNELEKLLMARIKRQKEEGELIDLETVKRDCFTAFRLMRDAVMSLPDRETSALMAIRDEKAFRRKFTEILRQPMEELQKFKHIDK